jgi:hypothetical protein
MSGVMEGRMQGSGGGSEFPRCGAPSGRPEGSREVRRKEEVVLRLLRGAGPGCSGARDGTGGGHDQRLA